MERLKEAFSKGTMVDIFSQIVEITVGSGICTIARKSIRTFVETFFKIYRIRVLYEMLWNFIRILVLTIYD